VAELLGEAERPVRCRRLTRRRGKAKAQVAVGNTQLKVYHKLLSGPGTRYEDLGPDYYDRRAGIGRQLAHHVGKLGALGFEVTLCRIPAPGPAPRPGSLTTYPHRRAKEPAPPALPRARLRAIFRVRLVDCPAYLARRTPRSCIH
jgi:hypothetical protein